MDLPTMAYMRRMEQPVRSGKGKIVRGLQSREMGKTPAFMRDVQEKMKQNERIHMGNYNTSVRRMQELTQERQQQGKALFPKTRQNSTLPLGLVQFRPRVQPLC